MSPVPVNPNPNFIPGTLIDADAVDANFKKLYDTLDPSIIGIDASNLKDGSVPTPKIVDRAVTAVKIELQPAWQTFPLSNPFTGDMRYMKDSLGFVRIRPEVWVGAGGVGSYDGTFFANLPAGYRPGVQLPFFMGSWVGSGAALTAQLGFSIETNGNIHVRTSNSIGAGNNMAPFAPIIFRAEN